MREIIYNGKALPIHFGLKAINDFTKRTQTEFANNITTTEAIASLEVIVELTLSGLNEGARRAKSDIRYTEGDVWDIFDDAPNLILDISDIFLEAIQPLTNKLGDIEIKNFQPTAKRKKR